MSKLETTLKIFDEGITSYSLGNAQRNIRAWAEELEGSGDAKLQQVAKDLDELHDCLGGDLDGGRIGEVLQRLGQSTREAAKGANGSADKLEQLGGLLTKAGHSLGKGSARKTA